MTHYGTNIRLIHITADGIRRLLDTIQAAGGDSVALCDHVYCDLDGQNRITWAPAAWRCKDLIWRDVGQSPLAPWQNSADLELVDWAVAEARARSMMVVIKPHLDWIRGGSRGAILPHPARRGIVMRAAYKRMLTPYAQIAHAHGAVLCLGTELKKITETLGAAFWITLAMWARSKWPDLLLTYAANWGWADDAEHKRLYDLWRSGLLVAAGIDAYYPLVAEDYSGALDAATLAGQWHRRGIDADWCPPIDTAIEALAVDCGIPVWLTELGYSNVAGALAVAQPWQAPQGMPASNQPQYSAVEAARRRWDGVLDRILFWESGHPGVNLGATVVHDIHRTQELTDLALAGRIPPGV